jgi:L-ascorbate metabolism protein UlaG (beta-lactamase superfamily)
MFMKKLISFYKTENMKITYYLYNTFLIETSDKKIAIDPGALFFYFFRFTTLIPKSEWKDITHIFVTHGDIDHYWHLDRVAEVSNAPVICNKTMIKYVDEKPLMLGPRDKGLAFTTEIKKLHTLSVNETIEVDGINITGIKATHGPLTIKLGLFTKTLKPGADERVGWGVIGFKIDIDGMIIVNLADTLLHEKEWENIKNPDILMIPIGGREAHNTMDEKEALQAIKNMEPKHVFPCHYNLPALFTKKYCRADDKMFKKEVEEMGIKCTILRKGDSLDV